MWLKDFIFDNEILSNDFTIYRKDRDSRGGGVMIAINNKIPSKQLPSPDNLDALIVQLLCNKKTFTLCLLYIPPNVSSACQEHIQNFLPDLSRYDNLILMGDFNLPDVDWESYSGSTAFSSSICEIIFDLNTAYLSANSYRR